MSHTLTTAVHPQAVPFARLSFTAFRVTELGNTYQLDFVEGQSLAEIVERGKVECFHKDHLLVREVDRSADHIPVRLGGGVQTRLHLFAIKRKSTPRYVYRGYAQERVHDLYAAPVCVMDGNLITAPTEDPQP